MKNTTKLAELNILGDIREYLGANGSDDSSKDDEINAMSPRQVCEAWSGWELGSQSWATTILDMHGVMAQDWEAEDEA